MVSIPRSGFCLFILYHRRHISLCTLQFQSLGRDSVCSYFRSGFLPFGFSGFNPSVGILFVHTTRRGTGKPCLNSVSIPRSGFCLFILYPSSTPIDAVKVSIPRSGFCLFIPERQCRMSNSVLCFNPSVGILFVHTGVGRASGNAGGQFQSLGRDSVCSYLDGDDVVGDPARVSIPRSGFCLFILVHFFNSVFFCYVSIPRSGFCLFILEHEKVADVFSAVSIPRSGFCLFIPG